jgi:formylglycine-generating enzyme required for sulfatase activity
MNHRGAALLLTIVGCRAEARDASPRPPTFDAAFRSPTHEGEILLPGGRFFMGWKPGDHGMEVGRETSVGAFWIDRTEVTTGNYLDCVKASVCQPVKKSGSRGCNANRAAARRLHPINCVDWQAAVAYCRWRGKRLPTRPEWEYAARGTDGREYPWGESLQKSRLCWDRDGTCPVGAHPKGASPFGVLDMAGNVAEWTATEGRKGSNEYYIAGGGYFRGLDAEGLEVRTHASLPYEATIPARDLGFRCARDAQPR